MIVRIPKSSAFPEIDFASKCIQSPIKDTVAELFYPLSDAKTNSIVAALAKTKLFVGEEHTKRERHIILTPRHPTETRNTDERELLIRK
jgi:hypothetical protein